MSGQPRAPQSLLVVSGVEHYEHRGRLWAFGPYAREIELWADLFPRLSIAAPRGTGAPPDDATAIDRQGLVLLPQRLIGSPRSLGRLAQAVAAPAHVWRLWRAIRAHDAVHVRLPNVLGMLGALLAPLSGRPACAKYAGQWAPYPGERPVVKLQRWLLRRWFRGPVGVYGEWPGEPAHIVPSFTSMMDRSQVEEAGRIAAARPPGLQRPGQPVRLLFAGRLAAQKRVDRLVDACARLESRGVAVRLRLVGDGPQRGALERQARDLGLADRFETTGALPFDRVAAQYAWCDVLVLPSAHEGWPKVLAEAMAHGVVCLSSAGGFARSMLDGRGVALDRADGEEIADAVTALAGDPERVDRMRREAADWAARHSREDLREAIRAMLESGWRVTLRPPATISR
ncbi:MAG: glycosyltransferase [Acidobacteria bacterium]|nr:MAG: glycosyltransferase [Acidobacteriota bacterium]REK08305.1 MAG: glycosyltransferase [Acidobacteriota bacterium]